MYLQSLVNWSPSFSVAPLAADAGLVFFVVFRETLETGVIVSVLLAFVKQALGHPDQDPIVYKKLVKQVKTLRPIAGELADKSLRYGWGQR